MAMLVVDGYALPDPSEFSWGLQDVSDSDSGRDEAATMHKNRIAQKRKLICGWQNLKPEVVATILQRVNPEYIQVTYFDAMAGTNQTRTFYVGDRSAPVQWWNVRGKIYSRLAFDLVER